MNKTMFVGLAIIALAISLIATAFLATEREA